MQFRVGVVVLGTLIITAILLVIFGKLPSLIPGRYYTIRVRFDYANGVDKDTPVRKSGVLIGRVTDVRLTDHEEDVMVTAKIQADMNIYQNEDCYITRDLLGGDTAMSFIPDRNKRALAGKRIDPSKIIQGRISDDPTGLKSQLAKPINTVEDTGRALKLASEKLGEAADRISTIFDQQTQDNVQSLLNDTAKSMKILKNAIGDEESQKKLSQAMKELPDTLKRMGDTFDRTDQTLRKFTEPSGADGRTAVDRMIATIEMTEQTLRKFSKPSESGQPPPADQIAKTLENLNEITSLIRTITSRMERGEGSLGLLLNDRQLYDRLNRAAKNIDEVSCRLKPIVDDARVITDKLARHPGVIIRDAVKPGVGIK
jgi:phospholipid/cholesterol/gamma-HCH transport system substrate-binding protein